MNIDLSSDELRLCETALKRYAEAFMHKARFCRMNGKLEEGKRMRSLSDDYEIVAKKVRDQLDETSNTK